jgi:hypothetical protein
VVTNCVAQDMVRDSAVSRRPGGIELLPISGPRDLKSRPATRRDQAGRFGKCRYTCCADATTSTNLLLHVVVVAYLNTECVDCQPAAHHNMGSAGRCCALLCWGVHSRIVLSSSQILGLVLRCLERPTSDLQKAKPWVSATSNGQLSAKGSADLHRLLQTAVAAHGS